MTYEEAKIQIQAIPEKIWDQLSEPDREAMEMAFSALQAQEAKTQLSAEGTTSGVQKTCITCKYYPPESKLPCIDCDMRNPADRWEAQELSNNSPKLDKENGDLQPTCNQLATDCISRKAAIDEIEYELEMINSALDSITLDFNARERLRQRRGEAREILNSIQQLPSAQPEQSDTLEFWRKRADYYSDMCMDLIGEIGNGVKIESVKISENGIEFIKEQPPAQPEPLTDNEQRIFLAAMGREEKVCEEVDRNYVREPYEDSLVRVCKEIRRKVKGALWI